MQCWHLHLDMAMAGGWHDLQQSVQLSVLTM